MSENKGNCPPPEAFEKFFRKSARPSEAEALTDHVRSCSCCRIRFKVLLELRAEVGSRREEFETLAAGSLAEIRALGKERRTPLGRLLGRRLSPAFAAVMIFAAAGAAAFLYLALPTADRTFRTGDAARLELLGPRGRLSRAPKLFRWTAVPGADFYTFELVGDDLTPIVPETTVSTTRFAPPPALLEKIRPGRTYIWTVQARRDEYGLKIVSAQQSFEIGDGD